MNVVGRQMEVGGVGLLLCVGVGVGVCVCVCWKKQCSRG